MTQPEPPTPPSDAPTEPSIPDLVGRPTATIEALLRERSQLDALLRQQFRREVTLLFSDIQGSTAYFERRGDLSGRQMVQRHNDILFPLIAQQQGTVLKTIGDAIMASFVDPVQAVQAAMAMQRVLRDQNRDQETAEQIHIRIGLNSGPALVEPQDIFGEVVNAAARVQACALPDQILISGATYRQLPATIPCRPVGAREVKGKSSPIALFEVCWHEGPGEPAPAPVVVPDVSRGGDRRHPPVVTAAPSAVPPLRSLDARPYSLPLPLTRFIGRARELHEVRSTLRSARLVTLTGAGGAGKTRLALQVAADLLAEYPDGTWFVEFAGTEDPALVPRVVSSTIGLREQQGRLLLDTLVDHLATKASLLVLDNCEHLLEACAALADRLLRACAGLTVLATSREPLGITGEAVHQVPPLSVPAAALAPRAEAVAAFEAVQLFVDRAAAVEPRFSLTDANAAAMVVICRRLEGIPLALELAAARLQALTVEQLRDRLEDRFRLLTSGSRTALPRQQTLRATVDWSHDLLTEPERMLFRRLSAFAGGFSLEAAEQVCGDRQVAPEDVLDLLTRLVGRSLALFEAGPAGGRYRLLDTIREYALEKLRQAGEEPELRRRHLQYYIGVAETAEPALRGPDQQAWLERLHAELDNFRAAFGWSLRQQAPGPTLRLASALLEFWVVRADWSEGLEWVEQALTLPGTVDPAVRMKALRAAAELADVLSDYPRSTARYEECLALARTLGDKRAIAVALGGLSHEASRVGRTAEARSLLEESMALLREVGDEPIIARSLGGLTRVAGSYAKARALWNETLAVRRRRGNRENVGWATIRVGFAAQGEGDYAAARAAYEEGLSIGRDLGYKRMIARSLTQLGEVALLEGQAAEARGLFAESLPLWEEIGHKSGLLDSLRGLGDVARQAGDLRGAEAYLQRSLEVSRATGNLLGEARALQSLGALAMSQGERDKAEPWHRQALALCNRMEDLDGIAASLRALGAVAAAEDQLDRAARLLGAAEALRERVGGTVPPGDRGECDRTVERVRSGLGTEVFSGAWEAGRQCTVAEVVGLALEATAASAEDGGAQGEAPENPSES